MTLTRAASLAVLAALLMGAESAPVRLPNASIKSVFHIEKSENRNQVHYAVTVDTRCRPHGKTPVSGYWREYEEGPQVVEALRDHQQRAYGVTPPSAITLSSDGGEVRLAMRALPDRTLLIATFRDGAACRARAYAKIKGQPAVLTSIFVEVGFLTADYVILRGIRVSDGAAVQERVDD
jgi:hypothetical protein